MTATTIISPRSSYNSNISSKSIILPSPIMDTRIQIPRKVKVACESCRRRKSKCSHDYPTCVLCCKQNIKCVYLLQTKKPGPKAGFKAKKRLSNMLNQNPLGSKISSALVHIPKALIPSSKPEISISGSQSQQPYWKEEANLKTLETTIYREKTFQSVRDFSRILQEIFPTALKLYAKHYRNMASLFHLPTFERKLSASPHGVVLQMAVLLATIRFIDNRNESQFLNYSDIYCDTKSRLDYETQYTSIELLQALCLLAVEECISGAYHQARQRTTRCIDIAHNLGYDQIDKGSSSSMTVEAEEKRRVWWCIWEIDFHISSMLDMTPTLAEWNIETFLPVDDELWFNHQQGVSSFLTKDPQIRWRQLLESKNECVKAWEIVVMSLSADIRRATNNLTEYTPRVQMLELILGCFEAALPKSLRVNDMPHLFPAAQADEAHIFALHLTLEGCKLLLYRNFCSCGGSLNFLRSIINQIPDAVDALGLLPPFRAWAQFVDASTHMVQLMRQLAPANLQRLSPLAAVNLWMAAVVQVVIMVFAGHGQMHSKELAHSKLDIAQLTLNRLVEHWRLDSVYVKRLYDLENWLYEWSMQSTPIAKDIDAKDICFDIFSPAFIQAEHSRSTNSCQNGKSC